MAEIRDDYNRGGVVTLVIAMTLTCSFLIYISFFHSGVSLEEIPEGSELEESVAEEVSFDIAKVEKPWLKSSQMAAYGKTVFKNSCAMCHGAEGRGDGPAGAALVPKPRDLVLGKWTKGGTSRSLFNTVTDGLPGTSMSGYKYMPVADRWALVQFIRSITKNKGADDIDKLESFGKAAK